VALLTRVLARPDLAEQRIGAGLRADRRLGSKDRPWVADALYGIVRRWRLIETLLTQCGWQGERPPEVLWWGWMVLARGLPAEHCPVPKSWLSGCAKPLEALEPWARGASDAATLATVGSVPDWLAEGLLEDRDLPTAMAELVAQDRRAPVVLRVAAHRTDRAAVLRELDAAGIEATPGRWSPHAVRIAGRVHLQGLACWRAGHVALQDEASQVVASLVAPQRDHRVVDACAGAGGKALALAATAPPGVRILALDVREGALAEARRRARREGRRLETQPISPTGPLPRRCLGADRVLIDAPCTGSGTLRRHAGLRWRWTAAQAQGLPDRQAEILGRFAATLGPAGRLVYATCSLWRAENQGVVDRFLAAHTDWEQIRPAPPESSHWDQALDAKGALELTPARHDTDGFFGAVLRRRRTV